jgi:beta-N-acetylhexosaminidase
MASRPLLMLDQEGGKVRRLKEKLGFAPLPSAKAFNLLPPRERESILERSFTEMRELGFHYDLAPVIDLDLNPDNPDIGKVERSFSAKVSEVRACFEAVDHAAGEAGLGLCLKHYPGLGGATVNSHEELTDLTGKVPPEQLQLFYTLGKTVFGGAVLVSHGLVRDWDDRFPVSMSPAGAGRLRKELPKALLLSDDLQMQGLQKILPSREASIQGVRAGLDMIIIGNNLMAEDERCLEFARALADAAASDPSLLAQCKESIQRVAARKALFS